MAPFESLGIVSHSHSTATMTVPLAVSTQYTNVTASHPARHTLHDEIGRLCPALRGNNLRVLTAMP